MRALLVFAAGLLTLGTITRAAAPAPPPEPGQKPPAVYVWLEPEWFKGVQGNFAYWPGPAASKPTGSWGVAGPGITPEFSQGGESEWQSMGADAAETRAACERAVVVPRAGAYRLWVRYVDHREKTEPFTVQVEQNGRPVIAGELGAQPLVPPNDEYMLYWDFSFGWAPLEGKLEEGPATLRVVIDKPGQAWRQVDAILLTDDLEYTPVGREKPPFAYADSFDLRPRGAGPAWRGAGEGFNGGAGHKRPQVAGKDFTMWVNVGQDKEWWDKQNVDTLTFYDVLMQYGPADDIKEKFLKQFSGRRDLPVMSWPHLLPGFYLQTPDLSPGTPLRRWLERTKTPFFILTNYANPAYDDKTGPATFAALTGPLAGQFLGYIHGEAIGTGGIGHPNHALGNTRRAHVDAMAAEFRTKQTEAWRTIYKTAVPETFRAKSISCLSVDSTALAHLFAHAGNEITGYELDATNSHAPMRVAFERGAARQFGRAWINYASGNFGDACNYFTQDPIVPRGAKGWWHSKYSVTDGVPISWYRQFYYLNYLSGANAIYWEQGLSNQWMLPGPGEHPVTASPFGRATADFQAFTDRLAGDRGEPYTPVAFLLSYGHGYEPVNYAAKMLGAFPEDDNDRELRGLFDVAWHPAAELASRPITPHAQSLPGGRYGNLFDVLVDRPERVSAINDYPIVWAAGDVELGGNITPALQDYLNRGGTLVVNVEAARGKLPDALLGVKLTGQKKVLDHWTPGGEAAALPTTPYEVERVELAGATALAWAEKDVPLVTRHTVGKGALILTLVPRMLARDERPHAALPWLMNGLTDRLLPVDVRLADGSHPEGSIMYQLNRTADGWLVMLLNTAGVDKTQTGIARVDRSAFRDVVLHTGLQVKAARELTQPRDLPVAQAKEGPAGTVSVRVQPGDVQVIRLVTQ